MKHTIVLLFVAAIAAAVLAGTASAATKDPRLCRFSPTVPASNCAQLAAENAIAKKARIPWPRVNLYCRTKDPRFLRWSCTWGQTVPQPHGTVVFAKTRAGWVTKVTVS